MISGNHFQAGNFAFESINHQTASFIIGRIGRRYGQRPGQAQPINGDTALATVDEFMAIDACLFSDKLHNLISFRVKGINFDHELPTTSF